ncbi:hypothetical protein ACFWNU_36025, partial [Streptomyces sp. NPDC058427]
MTDNDHSRHDEPSVSPQDRAPERPRPGDGTHWTTRPETAADTRAVYAVNAAAFPTDAEAALVDALRGDPAAWLPGLSYV